MNFRKNRRLNPRGENVILGYLFAGLLAAGLLTYGWSQFALTPMQSRCLPLYAETSFPLIHTVKRNAVRHALGDNIDPRDKSRVTKAPIYGTLHDLIYKGRNFTDIVKRPAEMAGVILATFLLVGIFKANRLRRKLENGIVLRGPERMTVSQFNKANKGRAGIELHVHEVIES